VLLAYFWGEKGLMAAGASGAFCSFADKGLSDRGAKKGIAAFFFCIGAQPKNAKYNLNTIKAPQCRKKKRQAPAPLSESPPQMCKKPPKKAPAAFKPPPKKSAKSTPAPAIKKRNQSGVPAKIKK